MKSKDSQFFYNSNKHQGRSCQFKPESQIDKRIKRYEAKLRTIPVQIFLIFKTPELKNKAKELLWQLKQANVESDPLLYLSNIEDDPLRPTEGLKLSYQQSFFCFPEELPSRIMPYIEDLLASYFKKSSIEDQPQKFITESYVFYNKEDL